MFIITGLVGEAAPPRFRRHLQLASDEDLAEEYVTEISRLESSDTFHFHWKLTQFLETPLNRKTSSFSRSE